MTITPYASIKGLSDRFAQQVFGQQIYVQEKVDGSQFSFLRKPTVDGSLELEFRSKGVAFRAGENGMFNPAVRAVEAIGLSLKEGYTYRGEFLSKPRHNILKYARTPHGHVVLFDIQNEAGTYLSQDIVGATAAELGFDYAPILDFGIFTSAQVLANMPSYLKNTSVLGGPIEGVVIKPVERKTLPDGSEVLAKIVSDEFKEIKVDKSSGNKAANGVSEILDVIITRYATPQRYQKAVQHLRDDGKLTTSMKDVGLLVREVQTDILRECEEDIKQELFDAVKKDLLRGFVAGIAGWYEPQLMAEVA